METEYHDEEDEVNALEEYRNDKAYLAEVCAAGKLEDLADAAIAELVAGISELVAELVTEREHPTSVLQCAACQRLAVVRNARLEAENLRLAQFEEAVRGNCFDRNSVDMSGKVRWARSVAVRSQLRQIFDVYGSEPLTPDG